ncbi:DUF4197 family protein [Altererythrobacter lutimaris]|nr:DUF4197 family protein [Altererythrobacter lutimaris]
MAQFQMLGRRGFIAGAGAGLLVLPFASPLRAQGLTDLLAMASDSALDKLAQPDAFYDDEDIRIKLPLIGGLDLGGIGGALGGLFGRRSRINPLAGLTRTVNDAAGAAAGEAKPIFRESIGALELSDAPGIIGNDDGGTRYLRESSGGTLNGKLRPLVDDAMTSLGAYGQLDELGEKYELVRDAGLTSEKLGDSVTEQALDGIFAYMGKEEAKFRANPLEKAGGLLKGLLD